MGKMTAGTWLLIVVGLAIVLANAWIALGDMPIGKQPTVTSTSSVQPAATDTLTVTPTAPPSVTPAATQTASATPTSTPIPAPTRQSKSESGGSNGGDQAPPDDGVGGPE